MDSNDNIYDIVIVGGGPAGIEGALQAKKTGLSYMLIEKTYPGSLIIDTMAEKKFYHVYGRNTATLKGALTFPDRITGKELVTLWQKQAETLNVKIDTVLRIQKEGDTFVVKTPTTHVLPVYTSPACVEYKARRVLLTSGTFENPRKLHVPGEEGHPNIFYALDYYNDYSNKTIIVVGGGNSALETAIYHGEQNKIVLIVRKDHFTDSVTEKNKAEVGAMVGEEKVEICWQSKVEAITGNSATINKSGMTHQLPFDYMFVHAGYEKPLEFLKSAGIEIEESIGGGKPKFDENFETNVQGLYIAGSLTGADSVIESANQAYTIVNNLKD
ncbi:MAG: NAD(P)/FAD-dependent oxidoreductase [Candidatus Vogelbacteria bacterium]|nr:NAD(P)/FAD-dependent oxidoreductase [Candidatus Vogelbacteria bacterium]